MNDTNENNGKKRTERKDIEFEKFIEVQKDRFDSLDDDQLRRVALKLFISLYETELSLTEARRTIQKLEHVKRSFEKLKNTKITFHEEYKRTDSWTMKLALIIRFHSKLITQQELSSILLTVSPELRNSWTNYKNRISQILTEGCSKGIVVRYKIPGKAWFHYGLPEWFDESGNIRRRYT
jgi:hypothetical protein